MGSILIRKVEKDYKIPGSEIVLEKGLGICIPMVGIHHDPEIYPNPDKFDPERFTKENIAARHPFAWIPFGEGPRNCVGLRFGLIQSKIGLIQLLRNFKFSPSANTPEKVKFSPNSNVASPLGGLHLKIEEL